MRFQFEDWMINQYWAQGYVIFRRIVPPSLLRDLRPEADKARALAHELSGPQAQRLQPIIKYRDRLDYKPFQDYTDLPILRDAIQRLFGPTSNGGAVFHTTPGLLGILVEPRERPRHFGCGGLRNRRDRGSSRAACVSCTPPCATQHYGRRENRQGRDTSGQRLESRRRPRDRPLRALPPNPPGCPMDCARAGDKSPVPRLADRACARATQERTKDTYLDRSRSSPDCPRS